jgi:hypothetical protein
MPDLAAVPVFLNRAEAFLEACLRIDSVQVVERNGVRLQPAKALLDPCAQHLCPPFARSIAALSRHDNSLREG